MSRYQELLACFGKPYNGPAEERCRVVSHDTTWEGERWVEMHPNGDTMTIGGVTIPMNTEFLVCKDHLPEEAKR